MNDTEPLALDTDARSWDDVRSVSLHDLQDRAGDRWTDHNLTDPGITMLETAAFAVADLDFRTAHRTFRLWSAESAPWRDHDNHHWSGLPLPSDPADRQAVADALAGHLEPLTALIGDHEARRTAVSAVMTGSVGTGLMTWSQAVAIVRLIRQPILNHAYFDHAHLIAAAVEAAATAADIATAIRKRPEFDVVWTDELEALVRRARHDRIVGTLDRHFERLVRLVESSADTAAALATLTGDPALSEFTPTERLQALALPARPPGGQPEHFEAPGGESLVWPPHPLQTRAVEPVVAGDYAGLARTVPGVRRAWVVPERLAGIDWMGGSAKVPSTDLGVLTILVERDAATATASGGNFLRQVLYTALGSADAAWAPDVTRRFQHDAPWEFFEASANDQTPRRVICDEIGVAVLADCEIVVRGVVHMPAAANHDLALTRIHDALAAFFVEGRPEHVSPENDPGEHPDDIDGPWPPAPPQPTGWNPGEAIRISELIQLIVADPDVLGAVGVQALVNVPGQPEDETIWQPVELPIAIDCVPRLSDRRCLKVQIELERDCD